MSCSSVASTSPLSQEPDVDDPLCITEKDRRQFKESESIKRKSVTVVESDGAIKKQKTFAENEATKISSLDLEVNDMPEPNLSGVDEDEQKCEKVHHSPDVDISEKLKMMDEISIKLLKKSDKDQTDKPCDDLSDKISLDIIKKDKKELNERKIQNMRKNIKDVLDESHLDATTLAAQRQESERLARVQEQQRLIRESQRQIAAEKQANKTQLRVMSILQGESSTTNSFDLEDPILEKFSLNSNLNITPSAKSALQSMQSLISTDDQIPDSTDDDEDDDDDVVLQPDESQDKSKAVVVDSSSDSDDCIILSDEEEDEIEEDDDCNSGEHTNDVYNQRDTEGRVVVNVGHGENESNIYVAPQIARVIKPHQIGGVRFLFDNIIESIELFDKSSGFGCILAHSMGLGKTLQLVCFCDIFLTHTNSKSILIIMPINTLQNWLHEFNMWLPLPEDVSKSPLNEGGDVRPRKFKIFVLNDSHKTLNARAKTVLEWSKDGGVLMMGYEMYRLLSLKKTKQKKRKGSSLSFDKDVSNEDQKMFDQINAALVNPGPDLVVCDEGHRIKNAHASTSIALKQIKSKRRVVLTGYPLQNNLLEYWCMVDFVRPSYLGTKTEFSNMFERPIQNGQCIDSTPQDCKLMRYRAHVLHSLLKGFVQRRSHTVLQKCLPEKTEFVLLVRMTPFQRKLYTVFMDEVVRSKKVPNPLKAFSVCCKIWNHPDVLYNFLKKRELDLDIELEESEAIGKTESSVGPKKRGRKAKEPTKESYKIENKIDSKITHENAVKFEGLTQSNNTSSQAPSDSFKPPITPVSNDSAYSSNQSINSTFDLPPGGYNSYAGYEANPYQNLNYNNGNGYQNWNGGNFWQGNYYQSDYAPGYYQQNSHQSYYGGSNYQQFEQKSKIESVETKTETEVNDQQRDMKTVGGLLAEVIQEETKQLRDKDIKDDVEMKDTIITKSSRDDGIPYDWAVDLMKDYVPDMLENSPKMEIFFCILEESIRLGDRLLVFSQSLLTLNILERFLQKSKIPNSDTNWAKNFSYFRLDGSTAALEREKLINEFNINTEVKLFLVSTRAGSLGINLVGANRVIVFDASWNPCHDTQAVCRVYRYGQAKSCFVYRFVMDNCLEKKIYDRQINKQGMAERVVDECNPDANLSMREVTSLCYDDGDDPELKEFDKEIEKYTDLVTKQILKTYSKSLTKEPFQHESLLVDRKEKKLSQAEKRLAQRGYEMEKQAAAKPIFNYNSVGTNYRAYRTPDGIVHRPVSSVRPMLNEIGDTVNTVRTNNPRPNRWVPVDVWQKKGITAQEMTLPQDVSIQTNSADKSKIYLKAGQKVIVLKSPKGICLQLESGKVIAIRASMKSGQQLPGVEQKLGGFSVLQDSSQSSSFRTNFRSQTDGDVIDISNDDDDEEGKPHAVNIAKPLENLVTPQTSKDILPISSTTVQPSLAKVPVYKEKVTYKPNLIQRKIKMPPPAVPASQEIPLATTFDSVYHPLVHPSSSQKYDESKSYTCNVLAPTTSNYNNRSLDEVHKNQGVSSSNQAENTNKHDELLTDRSNNSSAFHPPAGESAVNSYSATTYPSQNSYQNMYPSNLNYHLAPGSTNHNFQYRNSSFSSAHPSYHYPSPSSGNYDPNFSSYHQGYPTENYNQFPPPSSCPPPSNVETLVQTPYTAPPTNYGQWNYNN